MATDRPALVVRSALAELPVGTELHLESPADLVSGRWTVGCTIHLSIEETLVEHTLEGVSMTESGEMLRERRLKITTLDGHEVLLLDTSMSINTHLRIVGGELQVRGPHASRFRRVLPKDTSDPLVAELLDDLLEHLGHPDLAHGEEVDRRLGGWLPCRTVSS